MHLKIIRSLSFTIIATSLTSTAFATAAGPYIGIQGGLSNTNNTQRAIATGGIPPIVTVTPSNTGFGGRFFGGYNINQYVAVEAGFTHYANSTYNTNIPGKCNDPQIHENALDLVAKGMFPFAETFDVFAKAGVAVVRTSTAGSLLDSSTDLCGGSSANTTSARPTAAIGASYYLTQNWVADVTYSRVFKGSNIENADLLSLGISYHFVDKYCGQFLC